MLAIYNAFALAFLFVDRYVLYLKLYIRWRRIYNIVFRVQMKLFYSKSLQFYF